MTIVAKKRGAIVGTTLQYNVQDMADYRNALQKLVQEMAQYCSKKIKKLFQDDTAEEFFSEDASVTSQATTLINKLKSKFQLVFNDKSKTLAMRMVAQANKTSISALKGSLKDVSQEVTINSKRLPAALKETMKSAIADNVSLIRTIPEKYFSDVQGAVYRSITTGSGLKGLMPTLQKYEGISYRRAKVIALDQTRKTYASINEQRMKELELPGFEWIHSGGGHEPRPSHVAMNGNYYKFSDLPIVNKDNPKEPPRRGMPGTEINCGCTARPIAWVTGDEPIKWTKGG